MSETNKTIIIVGGIALIGFIAYRYIQRAPARSGTGNSAAGGGATSTGSNASGGSWWTNLGTWGSTLSGAIGTIDHAYSGLFGSGGGSSSGDGSGIGG